MITDPLRIDTAAARQASREFARSADDIVRAAGVAVDAIDNVSGAYERLRDSVLDLRTPLAESGLVDVGAGIANDLRLALDDPAIRQALLSRAMELQSTLSGALSKAAQGGGEGFEALLDKLSNQIETFGPALSLLGPKAAGIVEAVEAGIPLARLLAENFGAVISDAEKSLDLARSVLRTNAEISRLREDLTNAEGERANVIRQQLEDRIQQTTEAVKKLRGTFGREAGGLALSESFDLLKPARIVPFREIVQALDQLSRDANVLGLSQEIEDLKKTLLDDLPTRDGRSLRELLRREFAPINQRSDPNQPDRLLQRASLVFPDLTGLVNGFAPRFPGDAGVSNGANLIVAQSLQDSLPLFDQFSSSARRAFDDYANAATNVSAQVGDVIGKSLQGAEDALVQFVQTGKLDFSSLIDAMIADLIRLTIRAAVLGPLADAIAGAFNTTDPFRGPGSGPGAGGGKGGSNVGNGFTSNNFQFSQAPRPSPAAAQRAQLNVVVNNNAPGVDVQSRASGDPTNPTVTLDIVRKEIADDIRRGGSVLQAIEQTTAARRQPRAV